MTLRNKAFIMITTKCNQKCYYCSAQQIMNKYKDKSFDRNLFQNLNLETYYLISLIGGEPGLITKKDKDLIIKSFKPDKKYHLYTNGTNLNEWDFNLNSGIWIDIIYHITDFEKPITLLEKNIIGQNTINIEYNIIVNNKINVDKIIKFIKQHDSSSIRIRQDCKENSLDTYEYIKHCINKLNLNNVFFDFIETVNPVVGKAILKYPKLFKRFNKCHNIFNTDKINNSNRILYQKMENKFKNCQCDWIFCCQI